MIPLWIGLCLALAASVVTAGAFVLRYADPADTTPLQRKVIAFLFATACFALLLPPLDIYHVSSVDFEVTPEAGVGAVSDMAGVLEIIFLIGSCIILCGVLPALASMWLETGALQYESLEDVARIFRESRLKRATLLLLSGLAVLVVLGVLDILLRPRFGGADDENKWLTALVKGKREEFPELFHAILFAVAVISSLLVLIVWPLYSGVGSLTLPLRLWYEQSHEDAVGSDDSHAWDALETEARQLASRYSMAGRTPPPRVEARLGEIREEQRLLMRRAARHGIERRRHEFCGVDWTRVLARVRRPLGLVVLFLTACIALSVAWTSAQRAFDHRCGFDCSFLRSTFMPSPLDRVLFLFADVEPLGILVYALVLWILLWAALSAASVVGVRLGHINVGSLRWSGTSLRSLLVLAGLAVGTTVCLLVSLPSIAPMYSAFGSQTYHDHGTWRRCDLAHTYYENGPSGKTCVMTKIASMILVMRADTPAVAVIELTGSWLFAIASIASGVKFWLDHRKAASAPQTDP